MVPSRPVMPMVNRPVPELKEGWLSASALNEPDFVSFAMNLGPVRNTKLHRNNRLPVKTFQLSSMSSCRRPAGLERRGFLVGWQSDNKY